MTDVLLSLGTSLVAAAVVMGVAAAVARSHGAGAEKEAHAIAVSGRRFRRGRGGWPP